MQDVYSSAEFYALGTSGREKHSAPVLCDGSLQDDYKVTEALEGKVKHSTLLPVQCSHAASCRPRTLSFHLLSASVFYILFWFNCGTLVVFHTARHSLACY